MPEPISGRLRPLRGDFERDWPDAGRRSGAMSAPACGVAGHAIARRRAEGGALRPGASSPRASPSPDSRRAEASPSLWRRAPAGACPSPLASRWASWGAPWAPDGGFILACARIIPRALAMSIRVGVRVISRRSCATATACRMGLRPLESLVRAVDRILQRVCACLCMASRRCCSSSGGIGGNPGSAHCSRRRLKNRTKAGSASGAGSCGRRFRPSG